MKLNSFFYPQYQSDLYPGSPEPFWPRFPGRLLSLLKQMAVFLWKRRPERFFLLKMRTSLIIRQHYEDPHCPYCIRALQFR